MQLSTFSVQFHVSRVSRHIQMGQTAIFPFIGYQTERVGPFVVRDSQDNFFLGISPNQDDPANRFLKIVVFWHKMHFPEYFQHKVIDVHLPEVAHGDWKRWDKISRIAHVCILNLWLGPAKQLLTQLLRGAKAGTRSRISRSIRMIITHDGTPLALA